MSESIQKLDTSDSNAHTSAGDLKNYIEFAKWCAERSRLEIQELDTYISEKVQDLAGRFQTIAHSASEQNKTIKSAKNQEDMITIRGEILSYPMAVEELNKLTTSLSEGNILSDQQIKARKKINILSKALYNYAEKQEKLTQTAESSAQSITSHIKDIIIAFQFQDFVKQRLDHIDAVFDAMINQGERLLGENSGATIPEELAKPLLDKFFLSRVKENFVNGLNPELAANMNITIEEDDDGIELF
jgi:hypothetical protein